MMRYERYMAGYQDSAEASYDSYDSYSGGYDEGYAAGGYSRGGSYAEGYMQALVEVKKAVKSV